MRRLNVEKLYSNPFLPLRNNTRIKTANRDCETRVVSNTFNTYPPRIRKACLYRLRNSADEFPSRSRKRTFKSARAAHSGLEVGRP